MTPQGYSWRHIASDMSTGQCSAVAAALIIAYCLGRAVYNAHFHPLARYPGPKLAAITDAWWAYSRYLTHETVPRSLRSGLGSFMEQMDNITGRYPWIIESTIKQYGDVVRIAPNELVFLKPEAAKGESSVVKPLRGFPHVDQDVFRDIYLAQEKNLELFVQVGYDALDTGDGGITGETNPVKHRETAKKLAPAFSTRNFKAKEKAVHNHIDLFVQKMKENGICEQGAELRCWSDWLALDLSGDMTYGLAMNQLHDMKDSILLTGTLKLNLFLTMSQITRKFRLLTPLMYLTIPPSIWPLMPKLIGMNQEVVKARLDRRGKIEHLDYFEQLFPADKPLPEDKKYIYHLENVAGQLLLAGWQPLANQFYSLIFFILKYSEAYEALVKEIRGAFTSYDAINSDTTAGLEYLQACAHESLRLHQETTDGLPRVSPGAVVDGKYIPKGVTCQISYFAAARSPRFFTDPLKFRPERWLSPKDPRFDPRYKDDNLKASKPFSQGPRGCPGGPIALSVVRVFVAKVLWEFDLEATPGQDGLSFDKDFKFMTFWERPPFWVRFQPVERN